MIKLLNIILSFFVKPKPLEKVAFVIGHNAKAKGAYANAPLSKSEWDWSKEVAAHMVDYGPSYGLDVQVIYRPAIKSYSQQIKDAYAQVIEGTRFILESHFNAGGGKTALMLHSGSSKGAALGAIMAKACNDGLPWPCKAQKIGSRGRASVVAHTAPTVLLEPFFGDNALHNREAHNLGPNHFAHIYLKGLSNACKSD